MTPGMPRGPYAMSDEMVSVARWPLDIWATPWSAGSEARAREEGVLGVCGGGGVMLSRLDMRRGERARAVREQPGARRVPYGAASSEAGC